MTRLAFVVDPRREEAAGEDELAWGDVVWAGCWGDTLGMVGQDKQAPARRLSMYCPRGEGPGSQRIAQTEQLQQRDLPSCAK